MQNSEPKPQKFASFVSRIKAFLIDLIIILIPLFLFHSIFLRSNPDKTVNLIYSTFGNVLSFAYFVYFTYKKDGMTLGKKFFKIHVISENGKLTLKQTLIRYAMFFLLLSIIPILTRFLFGDSSGDTIYFLIFVAYIIFITLDKKKRGPHDMIARTIVVKNI